MVSMLPICIYISLMFGNYICDEGVQSPFSSRPGVELNLEGLGLGEPPRHPSQGTLLDAECKNGSLSAQGPARDSLHFLFLQIQGHTQRESTWETHKEGPPPS